METQNESQWESSENYQAFWPLLLVSLSLVIILVWQLMLTQETRNSWQNQFEQRKNAEQQSENAQAGLERMVNDLLNLADKGDADAKALVAKYRITRNQPTAMPPQPAK